MNRASWEWKVERDCRSSACSTLAFSARWSDRPGKHPFQKRQTNTGNTTVLFQFAEFGCIEDVTLGLRWSPAEFASEVLNRTIALATSKIKPRSTVVVAR